MIKPILLLSMCLATSPALACDPALFDRITVPMPTLADETIDVSELTSTEGGEWQVWRNADGAVDQLARIDYGEMGRVAARLVVSSADAYAITQTTVLYSAPLYVEGSMPIREETDIYVFCSGELAGPGEGFTLDAAYVAAAEQVRAIFNAPEIAEVLPDLTR